MNTVFTQNQPVVFSSTADSPASQRSQIKQELRQKIYSALQTATGLPSELCRQEINRQLLAIQAYCSTIGKKFVFVEEPITCAQYSLGGHNQDPAMLFRGPNEDASVAICVTHQGSLLYRNDRPWQIYKNAGDVAPIECLS